MVSGGLVVSNRRDKASALAFLEPGRYDKVKLNLLKIRARLACRELKSLGCANKLQVFMIHPDEERMICPLQLVSLLLQRPLNGQKLTFADVLILLRHQQSA